VAGELRGEEVDAAAAKPPPGLGNELAADLWFDAFDIVNGKVRVTPPRDGIYIGAANPGALSRSTLLTPNNVAWLANITSGRVYAWAYLDSSEALYALRAGPRNGHALELDPDSIVAWLRPRLVGSPPHKIAVAEYVEHLRELGIDIVIMHQRDSEARFYLTNMTTKVDRQKTREQLVNFSSADFEGLDWGLYDAAVGKEACTGLREVAGEVAIDVDAKKVYVHKARPGIMWASVPHVRSEVTFHTHPMARFQGSVSEPPSEGDLEFVVSRCALQGMIWHFVTAPEGTYILRPSEFLTTRYLIDPQGTIKDMLRAYGARTCDSGVMDCVGTTLSLLHDAGFVAFFRERPCGKLATKPDFAPEANASRRSETRADLAVHEALGGQELARADWSVAVAISGSPTVTSMAWFRARYTAGVIQPISGHMFQDPANERSYPSAQVPGPILVFFFPQGLPPKLPAAALSVAKKRVGIWPWMAFLSPSQVMAFRADAAESIEVYGPVALKIESHGH